MILCSRNTSGRDYTIVPAAEPRAQRGRGTATLTYSEGFCRTKGMDREGLKEERAMMIKYDSQWPRGYIQMGAERTGSKCHNQGSPCHNWRKQGGRGDKKSQQSMSDHCDNMALCDCGDQNIHEQRRRNLPTHTMLFSDVRMHTSALMEVLVRDDSSEVGQ